MKVFADYLRSEGYSPQTDKDGDIVFKCEGRTYVVIVSESDNDYVQIVYPNFWGDRGARPSAPRQRRRR